VKEPTSLVINERDEYAHRTIIKGTVGDVPTTHFVKVNPHRIECAQGWSTDNECTVVRLSEATECIVPEGVVLCEVSFESISWSNNNSINADQKFF